MYWLSRHRMLLLTILVMVGGTVLCAVAAGHYAWRRALGEESSQVQRQLQLYGQGLQQRIDRFGTLPQVLALDPDLLHALRVPPSPTEQQRLNLKLQRANEVTRASTLTLVGHDGVAVAASNWDQPTSNVGENYSYRPYYRQALAQGRGRFYGIGMTTGVPGYYLSQAIEEDGKRLGVVVIKVELSALEQEWLSSPDVVLASDDHDVVFLANRDSWRYRLLRPLGADERREMLDARQYADRALQPLRARTEDVLADGGRMVRLLDPALPQPMLWQSLPLPAEGWNLHLLHDASAATPPPPVARPPSPAVPRGWRWASWCCSCSSADAWPSTACAVAASWKPCSSSMRRNCVLHRMACCRLQPTLTAASAAAWRTCRRAWWLSTANCGWWHGMHAIWNCSGSRQTWCASAVQSRNCSVSMHAVACSVPARWTRPSSVA